MRINQDNRSMDIEQRDVNYILPAYIRSYLFYTKNELPDKIIFPMFDSVKYAGKQVPIEYVPAIGEVAVEIQQDGSNVEEVTPEQEAQLDEKDEKIKKLTAELEALRASETKAVSEGLKTEETPTPATDTNESKPDVPPAKQAFAEPSPDKPVVVSTDPAAPKPVDRQPKQPPGGDIGPGLPPSDMGKRDGRDFTRVRQDLMDEPNVNEAEEIPTEIEKPKEES